ncbi:Ankyrin repeat-containing domain protein [Rhypophila sp. PSN 637]
MASDAWCNSLCEGALLQFWASCMIESNDEPRPHEPAPTLYGIPVEIMLKILDYLDDQTDILALTRTNRWLYSVANPVLYANNIKYQRSSSIFWASSQGIIRTLALAHAAGADLNMRGPILYQPKSGHCQVVKWLIEHGADIHAPSQGICHCRLGRGWEHAAAGSGYPIDPQWTALHTALCHKQLAVAIILIDHNSSLDLRASGSPNDEEISHRYALHLAAARGFIPIIDRLHSHPNFNINMRDSYGLSALHHAAKGLSGRELPGGHHSTSIHEPLVKLLSLGANINAISRSGETPLVSAIKMGNFSAALKLLSLGANPDPFPNSPSATALRPLYLCVNYLDGGWRTAEKLKIYQWPCMKHKGGWYRKRHVHLANNTKLLIRALVDSGADVNARFGSLGLTALGKAVQAVQHSDLAAVSTLIRCGARVDSQDSNGETPLRYSLMNRDNHNAATYRYLIRHGASLDLLSLQTTVEETNFDMWEEILEVATKVNISYDTLEKYIFAIDRTINSSICYYAKKTELLLDFANKTYGLSRQRIRRYVREVFDKDDGTLFDILEDKGYIKLALDHTDVNRPENQAMPSTVLFSLELLLARALLSEHACPKMRNKSVNFLGISPSGPRFNNGDTLLHMAVTVEDYHILLADGANPYVLPTESQLEELFRNGPDPDETIYTPFDHAVSQAKLRIVKTILEAQHFPIYHQAQGADPNGGDGCPNPPAAMILRDLWDAREENDLTLDHAIECLGLLLGLPLENGEGELSVLTQVHELLSKICRYDGAEACYISIRELVKLDLGITAAEGEGQLVCQRSDGTKVSVTHTTIRLPQ